MSLVEHSTDSDGLVTISLNDPNRRNAMSLGMAAEFSQLIGTCKANSGALRGLIITGTGTAFSAGGDLEMLREKTQSTRTANRKAMVKFYRSFLSMLELPVPIVAAINGHAIGAGFCLALACDLRVVAADAKLGLNFVRLGLHPGMGATLFLPRLVGHAAAASLLLSGRTVMPNAVELQGVFQETASSGDVLTAARRLATDLSGGGPQAIAETLFSLRPSDQQLAATLEREAKMQSLDFERDEFRGRLLAVMRR